MSRIFDALRKADALYEGQPEIAMPAVLAPHRSRLHQRWLLHSLIHVYGHVPACSPFYREARTVNVSVRGALLLFNLPLTEGQDLLLINQAMEDPQVCNVVHVSARGSVSFEVGVEFRAPNPEFWKNLPAPNRRRR